MILTVYAIGFVIVAIFACLFVFSDSVDNGEDFREAMIVAGWVAFVVAIAWPVLAAAAVGFCVACFCAAAWSVVR